MFSISCMSVPGLTFIYSSSGRYSITPDKFEKSKLLAA
jgi:hypothetical protein